MTLNICVTIDFTYSGEKKFKVGHAKSAAFLRVSKIIWRTVQEKLQLPETCLGSQKLHNRLAEGWKESTEDWSNGFRTAAILF